MHSLRKNENISMWGKRIAPQQKKLLPFLPGSLLKVLLTETVGQIKRANEYLAEQQMKEIKKLKYIEPR